MSDLDELEEINLATRQDGGSAKLRAGVKRMKKASGARDMAKWKRQLTAYRVNKERAK